MRAIGGQAGREDGDLDRIDQDMILGEALEAVPAVAGLEHPGRLVGDRLLGHRVGLPDVEPPASPSAACFTAVMARRKLSASSIVSCTSARPAGCSIIAAATSQEAMMPYCGEVDVCIMNASLKRVMSSRCVLAVLHVDHRRLRQRARAACAWTAWRR